MARVTRFSLAVAWLACLAWTAGGHALVPGKRGYPCGCPRPATERAPVAMAPKSLSGRQPSRVHVLIDLERRELTLYFDHVPVRTYPVAVGKPSTPTPVGDWRIVEKAKWGEGFGSRWMQISVPWGTYGIHGTNKPWTIGEAVSGGCIRMFNEDADEVYEWVKVGTPVKIIGDPLAPLEERQTLEPGYMSSRVMLVQRALREAGYYAGPLDGAWGAASIAATKAFQKAKGFPVTGSFDTLCYDALGLVRFE
ncbi:MAG: L,D-transpeptidase family protein [Bacillota bacterium]|nr:L,D-transpeptidase family protein [Bacillota bacterium]